MANIAKDIKLATDEIKNEFQVHLSVIAQAMVDQIIKNAKRLPRSQILNSTKDIHPTGIQGYKSDLKSLFSVISLDAIEQARREVPAAKDIEFIEDESSLLFGEFEKLPPGIRKTIENANNLLVGTQIDDLEKAIFFQFGSSVTSDLVVRK